ncbi:nucleoside 2-deoxyribosyltransferase [Clostridium sp. Ade.TY]|uniref:nucleoside 2-deoxyribosyltransferase n=1 Tax=Clostridium sp. Ade.TY TaxID=1391647 RepID=UPI0003FF5479|nr:nucleoside 2-deoxyribosyltransferase [Clostridium sp. Ade.TY]
MKKVYLASPFFNDDELNRMKSVLKVLREEKEFDVFAPYELKSELEFGSLEWRHETFLADTENIKSADIVVAIISNGNYSDSGTAWECGYSHAIGKPVIVVNLTGKPVNLMISDSLHAYIDSIDKLRNYDFEKLEKSSYIGKVF